MSTRSQLTKDLNENVKSTLGSHIKILVKYIVKLEIKGDKAENRVLVFTPVRIYVLSAKVPTKIEYNFHYLDIQTVESKNSTRFSIITSDRTFSFIALGDGANFSSNADVILTDLASAIKQIFPTVPLKYIIRKIDIQPTEREILFSEELRSTDPRNVGACGGFSMQYACMCDFYGVTYREEVAWDIDTIYLSHDTRILNLRDFDHLEPRDLMVIVSAMEYNTFFRGLKSSHMRLSNETLERIVHVLKRSMWLEELHLEALGLKSDYIHKLSSSVITNNNPIIKNIDLSYNIIEDKGAIHLSSCISKFSKGISKLSLANCGLTSKGVNSISHSLSLNHAISSSLVYLDLKGNNLKDDITNLHNFLAQPNILEHLDLSSTDIMLENLFGALLRGCGTHLTHLNVSYNSFSTKKGKEIPPSFKQFFTSTLSMKHINIAGCKLPMEALKNLLLGLACNESTTGLHLDLSSNTLGVQGAHVLESCIHGVRVLQSLDISDNNFDADLAPVLTAISKNPSIKSLFLNRCFSGIKVKYIGTVMDALVSMIQKDDFGLAELVLAENKLKSDMHDFINSLGSNQSLQKLDITGNYIGDVGARLLAKALQINNKLRIVSLDRNNITLQGYADIVYALENNYSMRNIPFPMFDIAPHLKSHPDKTDIVMRKMQDLLQRNSNGLKRTGGQAFRLQYGFMSSTHQLMDKLVAETQETISITKGNSESLSAMQYLIYDAQNCKQLMPKLQEAIRSESHPIEAKLVRITNELHTVINCYLEEIFDAMIRTAIEQCPKVLENHIVIKDLCQSLKYRSKISEEFLQNCIINNTGSEIMNKVSEIEQTLAGAISDRITDEILEALSASRRGLKVSDSAPIILKEPATPDVVCSRPSNEPRLIRTGFESVFIDSSTATPHLPSKRRSYFMCKIRPQSSVENYSLGHIPDLLESPASHHSTSQILTSDLSKRDRCEGSIETNIDFGGDENCDSLTELPSASFQLQHLVKSRPKRMKTRAPTRALATVEGKCEDIGTGLQQFFYRDAATPTNLTPLVSPTSDECSSLSFIDSPTMSRDGNGLITSEECTPILEERKLSVADCNSSLSKGVSCALRSCSIDSLDKYSLSNNHKILPLSLLSKERIYNNEKNSNVKTEKLKRSERYSSIDSIRNCDEYDCSESNILRTPNLLPKSRPWSLVGNNSKLTSIEPTVELNSSTGVRNNVRSKEVKQDCDIMAFNNSSSIIGITPGIAIAAGGTGSGSIVGITPGAALDKKASGNGQTSLIE